MKDGAERDLYPNGKTLRRVEITPPSRRRASANLGLIALVIAILTALAMMVIAPQMLRVMAEQRDINREQMLVNRRLADELDKMGNARTQRLHP